MGIDSILGLVKVEEDGSFYLKVIADIPFRIRTLDKDGNVMMVRVNGSICGQMNAEDASAVMKTLKRFLKTDCLFCKKATGKYTCSDKIIKEKEISLE